MTCDICNETMTPDRGYIYGVHAKCAQLVIRKASKDAVEYRKDMR